MNRPMYWAAGKTQKPLVPAASSPTLFHHPIASHGLAWYLPWLLPSGSHQNTHEEQQATEVHLWHPPPWNQPGHGEGINDHQLFDNGLQKRPVSESHGYTALANLHILPFLHMIFCDNGRCSIHVRCCTNGLKCHLPTTAQLSLDIIAHCASARMILSIVGIQHHQGT